MIALNEIIQHLEAWAPPALQESYDNSGLIVGSPSQNITGVMVSLDVTEEVIDEAIQNKCNVVVAHHPIIFSGIKKLTGKNYVERTVIKAIKNDIAIYAIHTNLDHIATGVNHKIADRLGLINRSVLKPLANRLVKLVVFVPEKHLENVRSQIFKAGAGEIGHYSSCSFSSSGTGTFMAGENTDPFVGKKDELHHEKEQRLEVILPDYLQHSVVNALLKVHPYEEVAYDLIPLKNSFDKMGAGMIGELNSEMEEMAFLKQLKETMKTACIRHTKLRHSKIKRVAVAGGSGSFLLQEAKKKNADVFVTADFKYHEFFDAENDLIIADIGHYESEQFTVDLICEFLTENFSTFAIRKSEVKTNPINYL